MKARRNGEEGKGEKEAGIGRRLQNLLNGFTLQHLVESPRLLALPWLKTNQVTSRFLPKIMTLWVAMKPLRNVSYLA